MRILFAFILIFSMVGCAAAAISIDERSLLGGITGDFSQIKDKYQELQKFDTNIEHGPNFVSYSYDLGQSHSTPLMNPDYFWFKISLVTSPVEAFDLQPPILTIFIPRFKKYLKLRISSANQPLMNDLVKIFYQDALQFGGTNARWGANNSQSMPGRRGFGRFGSR